MLALASRALIHSRDGERYLSCIPLCIFSFEEDVVEIYLLNNFTMLMAFCAKDMMWLLNMIFN